MYSKPIPLLVFAFSFLIAACDQKKAQQDFIPVIDEVHLLTDNEVAKLAGQIKELETSVGSQIVILIINSLEGESIDDFSFRTGNRMGIGRHQYKDGVLITVAYKDRQVKISVGKGLEQILTNEFCDQINREEFVPSFRQEKFYEGLNSGVVKIKTLIKENKNLIGVTSQ